VVHARKHAERDVGIARKSGHGKEPATIAGVRLSLRMFMAFIATVVMMYNAIRVEVCASALLVSTGHVEIVDQAMNSPRWIKEGQDRTWGEGAKRIDKRDSDRDFDPKLPGKTCQHWLRK
jgi:hypothetical protein